MILFAQAAPPGTENFLAIAFYLVGGFTAVVMLVKSLRKAEAVETEIGGQPIKVKFAAQFATKEELAALENRVERVEAKIDLQFEKLREDRRASVAALHKRIEETTTDIRREIKTDTAGLHSRVTEVLAAFSRLQGAVQTAMKNTGHPFGS